ncbi:MAG: hypothetical protein GWN01_01295 [Nitrosopumilaceae archaeon]|nr:hypothetical protein [Nitrosopumilaceae archaeon]NIU85994.1 hypothetical protein [Nitrosopumilaceae archaeon]NIX60213.1 hypothetical protein [Nitrosopumilaceae archaeon]
MVTFRGFQTIDELVNYYYNVTPNELIKAGFSTSDAGAYNPIFSAIAWGNFNLEANLWSALPKFVWDYSGARLFTAKGNSIADKGTNNNTTKGGITEGGLIPDSVKPTIVELQFKPKTLAYPFEVTELHEHLVEHSRDDIWGSLAHQRVYASDQMKELLNQMLTFNPEDYANEAADDLGLLDLEHIPRIVSSDAEEDAAGLGWNDAFDAYRATATIDRDSGTTYDSTVVSPSDTLGTADVLTNSVITDTEADIRIAGGKEPTLYVGGQDTYSEVQKTYFNAYRIQNTTDLRSEFNVTVNGIDTFAGTGVGLAISTVYGKPFIPTKDNPSRASTQADDLFILNTSADKLAPNKPMLGLQMLKPMLYYEASKRQQGWPFIVDAFKDRAIYEMLAECTCRNFKAQGKIRDILKGA